MTSPEMSPSPLSMVEGCGTNSSDNIADVLPVLVDKYLEWKDIFGRRDSPAWAFFETEDHSLTRNTLKKAREYKLKCMVCSGNGNNNRTKGIIKFVVANGSKSLITHAKKHESLFIRVAEALKEKRALTEEVEGGARKKTTVMDALMRASKDKYDKDNPKQIKFERNICYLVCKDLAPFRVVCHEGLQRVVYDLDPRITFPSAWQLTNKILPQMVKGVVDGVVKPLLDSADFVSFSFDLWMSAGNQDIVSLVAHVLSDDWQLKTVFLALSDVKETKGAVLSKSVYAKLTEYKLTKKAVSCVVDGGANVKKSVTDLSAFVRCDMLDTKPFTGKCWAHILNNVLKKMMLENK